MGQTGSSHQHHHGGKVRNEFMKANSQQSYPNHPHQPGAGMSSTQSAIGNYDYHNDMEDEELSYPPIFPSKDSYVRLC